MIKKLFLTPLTNNNFKEFGSIIKIPETESTFSMDYFEYYNGVEKCDFEGKCSFSILTIKKRRAYLDIIERHNKTSEVMVAMDGDITFIVVGIDPTNSSPVLDKATAFYLQQGQGVIIKPGVWHWVPFSIGATAKLLFIYKDGTTESGDIVSINIKKDLDLQYEID